MKELFDMLGICGFDFEDMVNPEAVKAFVEGSRSTTEVDFLKLDNYNLKVVLAQFEDDIFDVRYFVDDVCCVISNFSTMKFEEFAQQFDGDLEYFLSEILPNYQRHKRMKEAGLEPRFNHNSELIGWFPIGSPYTKDMATA